MSSTNDQFIDKLTEILEANFEKEHFGVSELAKEMGMSRSNLHRKLKATAKISANQYINHFRLQKGLEILKQTNFSVSEVAYNTGFSSPSYFIKCFGDYYGYSPGEVGNRKENDTQPSKKTRKKRSIVIISFFSILLLAITIFIWVNSPLSILPTEKEKSIAILPFIDDSPEEGNAYIVNGLMDEILDKLQKIDELDIKSRTDSEKYRNSPMGTKEIARELNVNYILEGRGQKIENEIKLRIQLIEVSSGNHLWSKSFTENIEDIFKLQENIALAVASELKIRLSGTEKEQIKEMPTDNIVAYNLYLRGLEHLRLSNIAENAGDWDVANSDSERAKELFLQAVAIDSLFAEAYVRISHFYMDKIFFRTNSREIQRNYLDTGFYYADAALKYDADNLWAIDLFIKYYGRTGQEDKKSEWENRLNKFSKTPELENNYSFIERQFSRNDEDNNHYEALKYYFQYCELKPPDQQTPNYMFLGLFRSYAVTGFPEQAESIAEEILSWNNDTTDYLTAQNDLDFLYGENEDLTFLKRALQKDTTNLELLSSLKNRHLFKRNYDTAYYYLQKIVTILEESGDSLDYNVLDGFLYNKKGFTEIGNRHLDETLKNLEQVNKIPISNNRQYFSFVLLACIHSFRGETEKALQYLEQPLYSKTIPRQWIIWLKKFPMFDNIRNMPEFIQILREYETSYQKEHDKIAGLLREVGMLE